MEAEREKTDVSNILKTILKEECVYTVFQPIVNLVKGTILGYEA